MLEAFHPVFVEAPEDLRALSMDELLKNSRLEPLKEGEASSPQTLSDYLADIEALEVANPEADPDEALGVLNINDSFARNPGALLDGAKPVYYGRALKCSNLKVVLQYVALRSGSFFPAPYLDDAMWGHEGDGEGIRVIIRRRKEGDPWLLAGLLFMAKHYKRNCSCSIACEEELAEDDDGDSEEVKAAKELMRNSGCINCDDCDDLFKEDNMMNVACEIDPHTNRPLVYVALGSHAMGPTAGPRWTVFGSIDHFPENTDKTRIADYELRLAHEPFVRRTVFTRRVKWGKSGWADAPASSGHHEFGTGENLPKIVI